MSNKKLSGAQRRKRIKEKVLERAQKTAAVAAGAAATAASQAEVQEEQQETTTPVVAAPSPAATGPRGHKEGKGSGSPSLQSPPATGVDKSLHLKEMIGLCGRKLAAPSPAAPSPSSSAASPTTSDAVGYTEGNEGGAEGGIGGQDEAQEGTPVATVGV